MRLSSKESRNSGQNGGAKTHPESLHVPRIEYFTADDGYRCAVRVWKGGETAGRVVCVHGVVSHGGWYLGCCRHLASSGFEVHFVDRRGSGLNMPARGDVDRYETWLNDVAGYLERLPPVRATVLLGVSWGGKFAAAFARYRPDLIDGVGLLCPGLYARQMPGPLKNLGLATAGTVGLKKLQVPVPLQDPTLFTESLSWQDYVRDDPFTLRRVTVRFALADRQLNSYSTTSPEEIKAPVLLVLAGKDRIVDIKRVRRFVERIGSQQKRIIEYPDAAHTLEFEPDPMPYFEDLTGWARQVVER